MQCSGWSPTRGGLRSTSPNAVHAAQRRPAMAYGGINVHKKQRQIGLLTESEPRLPQCIPPPREQCAAVCAERPKACLVHERPAESVWGGRKMHTTFSPVLDRRRRIG